ncbi:MAG: type II toxin-antitoxin system Phd/YefM family antitoxin [Caulobacteraceae bacterium]
MRTVRATEAKARLSALIEWAANGQPTTITRHGRPAAVPVSVEDARRLCPADMRSFADVLLSFPGGVEFERDRTPPREVDL